MKYNYKIKDKQAFNRVFGADCFLKWWPELLTTGVWLSSPKDHPQGWRYIMDPVTNRPCHDTAFFTRDDMKCLKRVASNRE